MQACEAAQALSQAAQALASVRVFLHWPPQQEKPVGQPASAAQLGAHTADAQIVPGKQSALLLQPVQRWVSALQAKPS
jgi:hypothetical protein